MALFTIKARREHDGDVATFLYDNINSRLMTSDGQDIVPHDMESPTKQAFQTSLEQPAKKGTPRTLKISLGLSCNYSCEYCSQRFVPRSDETNKTNIEPFLESLDSWVKEPPERIEFWGGEPLVYVKTLVPLAEALAKKYPDVSFTMITNGALLNPEINEWLDRMGFSIGLSHDAQGQHIRGPDPFEDEEAREGILDLYKRLAPQQRISFNTMMHKGNQSRADVQRWWVERFGPNVSIGEGAFVDPYDEGGVASSLQTQEEQVAYRTKAFEELRRGLVGNFDVVRGKMQEFVSSLRMRRDAYTLGQKCGMDREDNIAVDLRGNVLTCQNVSAVSMAPNGQSNKIGHVSEFDKIELKTATHWAKRDECKNCPVLQLCKGSCMFLEGDLWDVGCDNSFSDNLPFFAGAIEYITGYKPEFIDGPQREDRKDIWVVSEAVKAKAKKKIILIKTV